MTCGRKLRVDSTVVETTIHHPTDSGLLADSVRRLTQQLHRVARRKGAEVTEELSETCRRLIRVAKQSRRQAIEGVTVLQGRRERDAQRLEQQLTHLLPLVDQVIDQTRRRVIDRETVPATEKLASLFEPATQIIKRQKPGKPVEFGRTLWLEEVEGGIVSGYRVLDQPDKDAPYFRQSLVDHARRFGKPPWLVAGDRGGFSATNERLATEAGVTHVVIPDAGTASAARKQRRRRASSGPGSASGRGSKGGSVSWDGATGWIAAPNTGRRGWAAGSGGGSSPATSPRSPRRWPRGRHDPVGILLLVVLLTLRGIVAALWYRAWWIAVAFFVMVVGSQVIVIVATESRVPKRRF